MRALPWIAGSLAAVQCGRFLGFPLIAVPLGISFAVLIGLTIYLRVSADPDRSQGLMVGLYGACLGAILAALAVWWSIRESRSSTAALGILALPIVTPIGMLAFGAAGWSAGTLRSKGRAPASDWSRTRLWVARLLLAVLVVTATFLTFEQLRHWSHFSAARSASTKPEELARLALDPDVAREVARNPSTPVDTLRTLAGDPESRYAVAANRSSPVELLTELAQHEEAWSGLAWNVSTPEPVLRRLALAARPEVREVVARNHNTATDVVRALTGDEVQRVRVAAETELDRRNPAIRPADRLAPAVEPR